MIEIIGIAILSNFVTHWFAPIQKVKYWIVDRIPQWLSTPLLCSKCLGFWLGLIYFQNPILAAITSFTAYLIDNIIYQIELWKEKN